MDEECTNTSGPSGSHEHASAAWTTSFFVETSKLYRILDNILGQIYDPWKESEACRAPENNRSGPERERQISRIIEIDTELNKFEAGVPSHLHWSKSTPDADQSDVLRRQQNVLRTRYGYSGREGRCL